MMDSEITACLLEIIRIGLLNIRILAAAGRMRECAIEADHLHNIPETILSNNIELVIAYMDFDRTTFMAACTSSSQQFMPFWERIATRIHARK
jgi:hypothetical protein